ncbi:MAG TPA: hypothetical protein ENN09_03910, partial [Planctomycetes bacterium]|nr:hypothetical protein [Planctomycetota bacterium]
MPVLTGDVKSLVEAFVDEVRAWRKSHPLEPYLVLVPGYEWARVLKQSVAAGLEPVAGALPPPGGEYLDMASASARTCGRRRARRDDMYEACVRAAEAIVGGGDARPALIQAVKSGFAAAYAAGMTYEHLSKAAERNPSRHGRLHVLARGMEAFAGALKDRNCLLPEQMMTEGDAKKLLLYGALFVFGFYDLAAAQQTFMEKVLQDFREAGRRVAVFLPVPEGGWGEYAG